MSNSSFYRHSKLFIDQVDDLQCDFACIFWLSVTIVLMISIQTVCVLLYCCRKKHLENKQIYPGMGEEMKTFSNGNTQTPSQLLKNSSILTDNVAEKSVMLNNNYCQTIEKLLMDQCVEANFMVAMSDSINQTDGGVLEEGCTQTERIIQTDCSVQNVAECCNQRLQTQFHCWDVASQTDSPSSLGISVTACQTEVKHSLNIGVQVEDDGNIEIIEPLVSQQELEKCKIDLIHTLRRIEQRQDQQLRQSLTDFKVDLDKKLALKRQQYQTDMVEQSLKKATEIVTKKNKGDVMILERLPVSGVLPNDRVYISSGSKQCKRRSKMKKEVDETERTPQTPHTLVEPAGECFIHLSPKDKRRKRRSQHEHRLARSFSFGPSVRKL